MPNESNHQGRAQQLRWAGGVMMFLGVGHLLSSAILGRAEWKPILDAGLVGALKLGEVRPGTLIFWVTVGGFGIPLFLLGQLVWANAARPLVIPRSSGPALLAFAVAGALVLPASPFWLALVPAALLIRATRSPA